MLLAMNKVEGDNISGVCFVGLYDLDASVPFVLLPLCLCVFVGLSLLLAGIISLNHVRQVIQHDGRNQEKLKKFMIDGVFQWPVSCAISNSSGMLRLRASKQDYLGDNLGLYSLSSVPYPMSLSGKSYHLYYFAI